MKIAIGWKGVGLSILNTSDGTLTNIDNVSYCLKMILWSTYGYLLFGTGANSHLCLWVYTSMTAEPQRIHLTAVESVITSVEVIGKNKLD